MASSMLRIKMEWSGFHGAPGITNFYMREFSAADLWTPTQAEINGAAGKVSEFAFANKGSLAPGVNLKVASDVELIEASTGQLLDVFNAEPQPNHTSTAQPNVGYSGGSGLVINWRTSLVRRNRRIRGRTFLVPLQRECFGPDGTLLPGTITGTTTAAQALMDSPLPTDLGVWARPTPVKDPATGKPTGEYLPDGQWARVASCNVPDLAAVLRTRRD
jgi:hypothetical protein